MEIDYRVIDITYELGFIYEQSFICALKKEFELTPSELRKSGRMSKITPLLQMFPERKLAEGTSFGPGIVMVPEFHLIGRKTVVPFSLSDAGPPQLAKSFWSVDREKIKDILESNVYHGLTRIHDMKDGYSFYMPLVKVKKNAYIPSGFEGDVLPACTCARFHYIGKHHYYDINADIAHGMYDAIVDFVNKEGKKIQNSESGIVF